MKIHKKVDTEILLADRRIKCIYQKREPEINAYIFEFLSSCAAEDEKIIRTGRGPGHGSGDDTEPCGL